MILNLPELVSKINKTFWTKLNSKVYPAVGQDLYFAFMIRTKWFVITIKINQPAPGLGFRILDAVREIVLNGDMIEEQIKNDI